MKEGTNKRESTTPAAVPKRPFGNTGERISKLCLGGGSFMGTDGRAVLDEALKCGVDCWEIVSFAGNAYREYFKTHPGLRQRVFLSGKVYSANPTIMQEHLDKTLEENGVSVIDFLAIHAIDNIAKLTGDVRKWAEKAKKDGKIRFFGFCTHKNMEACLNGAADLGWIDGIQTVYNYRLQSVTSMEDAVHGCHNKGIGVFAVKSMGLCVMKDAELPSLPVHTDKGNSLLADHDVSFEQAKLKALWQNPHVTSICSLMPTAAIVRSNAAVAMDERPLDDGMKQLLATHADSTRRYYCRRCGRCETANVDGVPIFDIMEMLMYSRRYGRFKEWSVKRFAQIPIEIRSRIARSDYSRAEKACPQEMPIAQLMKEAHVELNT